MQTLRLVIVPVASAYAVLIGVVLYAARHPERPTPRVERDGWPARLRLIVLTVVGGYGCFLAIVLVFHVVVAGQHGAMASALRGGAFIASTSAVAFVLVSLIEAVRGSPGADGGSRKGRGHEARRRAPVRPANETQR